MGLGTDEGQKKSIPADYGIICKARNLIPVGLSGTGSQLGDGVNVSKSKENQHTSMSKSKSTIPTPFNATKEVVPFQQHLARQWAYLCMTLWRL